LNTQTQQLNNQFGGLSFFWSYKRILQIFRQYYLYEVVNNGMLLFLNIYL
jgi:hypothetical protein